MVGFESRFARVDSECLVLSSTTVFSSENKPISTFSGPSFELPCLDTFVTGEFEEASSNWLNETCFDRRVINLSFHCSDPSNLDPFSGQNRET